MEGKKSRTNSNTDFVFDRISSLPNSILGHILSFLRTKEAVATSVLSKRWKIAWVTVHNLDFYYPDSQVAWNEAENMKFVRFVLRVLLLIDAGPLNKFSLDWPFPIFSHVICWIDAAIIRNVRELYLYLGRGESLKMPISGFNCDSLQSLELNDFTFVYDATMVCLPRLESLKLNHVHFTSKEACEKLISGCPSLHNLKLTIYFRDDDDDGDDVDVDADGDFMCIISSASLTRLDIYFGDRSRLKRLKLKASSLEYLRLRGCISEIFVEKSLIFLVQADFDIDLYTHDLLRPDEHDFLNNSIVEAVCAFEHAKVLTLSADVMQALSCATINLSIDFKRLVKMKTETLCCHWSSLRDFIQNSNNLEVLKIHQFVICLDDGTEHDHSNWTTPVEVPRCLSTSLKKVVFDDYNGFEDEREMIRYMLKHGSVLEVVQISCDSDKNRKNFELLQEICEFPRNSPACEGAVTTLPWPMTWSSYIDSFNDRQGYISASKCPLCSSLREITGPLE